MSYRLSYDELEARRAETADSPQDQGTVEMIVRRPEPEAREEMPRAQFSIAAGLNGDDWLRRSGEPNAQITLMNSRVIQLLSGDKARWAESGDQLFVDLDISEDNLPAGTRLQIGGVLMEVSPLPHTGCNKFARRFGVPARKWVMSDEGKQERRRGMYTRVIEEGEIAVGDTIRKL